MKKRFEAWWRRVSGQDLMWRKYDMNDENINNVRTDLALEAKNSISEGTDRIDGISVSENKDTINNINVVRMRVRNRTGSEAIGKPVGTYITMEVPNLTEEDSGYHREISESLAHQLKELVTAAKHWDDRTPHILVAGLGNRDATADALGPNVVSNLMITRHIVEYMGYSEIEGACAVTSAIVPGVMAQTGIDTCELIGAVVRKTKPDVLIVVDALAARSIKRLNATIQITDTGIHPGSGVGNDRQAITRKTMGIPVIAIGVPTVVDARSIVYDSVGEEGRKNFGELSREFKNMYVTSKDIDAVIKRVSYTVSEAINICMGLSAES